MANSESFAVQLARSTSHFVYGHGAGSPGWTRASNIVDAVVGSVAFVCSLIMVALFIWDPARRKLRHKLIFGLSLADLFLSCSLTIPTFVKLAQGSEVITYTHCQVSGIFIVISYWSTHCHAAFIAVATKWLLMEPCARKTMRLERNTVYVTSGIFLCATIIALSILKLGYSPNAGFCYIPSSGSTANKVVYATIIFGTRSLAMLVIAIEYGILYRWLIKRSEEVALQDSIHTKTPITQQKHYKPIHKASQSYLDVDFQLGLDDKTPVEDKEVIEEAPVEPQESLAAYENKLAARAMLWYPIFYLLCFAPSLANFIYAYAKPHSPNQVLHALARWFSTSQAILDFIVYAVVENRVRHAHRRKVQALGRNVTSTAQNTSHISSESEKGDLSLAEMLKGPGVDVER